MPNRLENAASKTMGAAKSAKAVVKGFTGVFQTLTREHGEVTALLLRVKLSSDRDTWAELFPVIRRELLAHEKGEMSELYPVFRQHEETRAIAEHHDREAGELDRLIAQLHLMPVATQEWKPLFERLVEKVQHHAKEEESKFFPAGQRAFGDESEALLVRYEQAKAAAMRELG